MNRLAEVISVVGGPSTIYTYDENGNKKSVAYPSGTKEDYTYNKNNQLVTLKNYQGTTLLDMYTYDYDNANNQKSKTETVQGVAKGTTSYTYDALNRLKSVLEPGGKLTEYTFDAVGNRTVEKVTNGSNLTMTTYTYNEQNRLLKRSSVDTTATTVSFTYNYDNNGSMIHSSQETVKKTDPLNPIEPSFGLFIGGQPADNPKTAEIQAGSVDMTYDVWNQLIASTTGGQTAEYQYNGDGLRVQKVTGGKTTRYLYEYDQVVLETDESGKQTARNIYGTHLLTRIVDSSTYNYLYNGHADVTALVDTAGTIQGTYSYDAFGNILSQTGTVNNPIRYAGYQYDDETKLYYLNARFYDPKIARFLSEDTYSGDVNDPLSLNVYTYVSNNPILYMDPTGHWQQSDKNLNIEAQAKIIALTSAYYNASSPQEKKAIQAQADAVRTSAVSKASVVTPLVFQTAQITQVVNKAVETRGFMTAPEWKSATVSAGIKTAPPISNVNVSSGSTSTTTITTIGRTNLSVSSKNIVTSKSTTEVTSTATAKIDLSYNVTDNEAKFVQSVASDGITLEQVLVVLDTLERNKGNITKAQVKAAGIEYVSDFLSNTKSGFEMAYDFSQKGMTLTEAEIKYQQQVTSKNIDAAFGVLAIGIAGGGLRINSAKETSPTVLRNIKTETPSRTSGQALSKPTAGDNVGSRLRSEDAGQAAEGAGTTQVQFNGKTVIQNDSLFDPNFVDKQGRTNIQRMQEGLAPIGRDGKSVNIHHVDQTDTGPVMEISASDHQQNYSDLHQNTGQTPSQIDRPAFDKWRAKILGVAFKVFYTTINGG